MLRAVFCSLLLLCTVDGSASDPSLRKPAGILYAAANTKLNGSKVPSNISVFEEDTIESVANENALISLGPIASLRVYGGSRITLHKGLVQLRSGKASVSTKAKYALKAECLAVEPSNPEPTMFVVAERDDKFYVTAAKGNITVKTRKETLVPQGKTAVITACGKPAEVIFVTNSTGISDAIGVAGVGGLSIIGPWIGQQEGSPSSPTKKAGQ